MQEQPREPSGSPVSSQGCLAFVGSSVIILTALAGIVGGLWFLLEKAFG